MEKGGPARNEEWATFASDGHRELLETTKTPVFDSQGQVIGVLGIGRDISERKSKELALIESEARWKFAIEGAGDGLWDWSIQTGKAFYSPRYKTMLGFAEEEIGDTADEWNKRIHPDDTPGVLAALQPYLEGKPGSATVEFRMLRKDGSWMWTLGRGMVVERDAEGKPLRMIGTNSDITERKRAEALVSQLVYHDTLTQLPNRRLLVDRMSQAMSASKRSGNYGALMMLDLDNFKPLNDANGHLAGDLLLNEVAKRLIECVRETDTVARVGGDEFVVMLGELDADKAGATRLAGELAEKIRASLAKPYRLNLSDECQEGTTVEHCCSASVGVVLFLGFEASQAEVMKRADSAMYRAKVAGRNVVHFYD
jgi:diguanylate cyclase (GGDEF)-like protein/PAS domain S-box-containing protein